MAANRMEKWRGRNALVTGASRGIGFAVTDALVREGMNVVAVARHIEELEQKAPTYSSDDGCGSLVPMKCDLADSESIKQLFQSIHSDPDLEGVDVIVNNAALAYGESILTGKYDTWKEMIEVNMLAPALITQEGVVSMIQREVDDGHIIYMGSMAGHRLLPGNKGLHVYSMTKFALKALVEGVRLELRQQNSHIKVTSISPGVVETGIYKKLFPDDEEQAKEFLSERKYLEADDIASMVKDILSTAPHVQIHDIMVRSTEQIP